MAKGGGNRCPPPVLHPWSLHVLTWLVGKLTRIDPTISSEKLIWLQIDTESQHEELAAMWLIAETLAFTFAKRKNREDIVIEAMESSLKVRLSFMENSLNYIDTCISLRGII